MIKFKDMFGIGGGGSREDDENDIPLEKTILQEAQQKQLQEDMLVLDDEDGRERVHKEAEREVQSAAEDSLKKLHVVQMGRCPQCGEHLQQHLFALICEGCGWHTFDTPDNGPVRIHLKQKNEVIEGDRCYLVKTGFLLLVRNDMVVAKISQDACDYIEYVWDEKEVEQMHRTVAEQMKVSCGWCGKQSDPDADGFHMVHVAFGASQERYCFCSDDCYEAFRKMYPSRVHRDCYSRDCDDCGLCIKRYSDEGEGIRALAKDYIAVRRSGT